MKKGVCLLFSFSFFSFFPFFLTGTSRNRPAACPGTWRKMNQQHLKINLSNLIASLSAALDLEHVNITEHSQRVAYIALSISDVCNFQDTDRQNLFFSALLHDIGISSLNEKLSIRELDWVFEPEHGERGSEMLSGFPPFEKIAEIIKYHHEKWENLSQKKLKLPFNRTLANLICLSDRIELSIDRRREILSQRKNILEKILPLANQFINPELIEGFKKVSEKESFWFDLWAPHLTEFLQAYGHTQTLFIDIADLKKVASIFSRIVDNKSRFTEEHSAEVARIITKVAERMDFSGYECDLIGVAGHLHDLGKLAVPDEVLNKPGRLTPAEFDLIKRHPYFTYRILNMIEGFETIRDWAGLHHEKLNGKGYPFHLEGHHLSLGSRILAVTEIYQALNQNRPYRLAMPRREIWAILDKEVNNKAIDGEVVKILKEVAD